MAETVEVHSFVPICFKSLEVIKTIEINGHIFSLIYSVLGYHQLKYFGLKMILIPGIITFYVLAKLGMFPDTQQSGFIGISPRCWKSL